ncbi:MAG TPA: hypothetical protein VIO11_00520 [Candidatus Methanoperedens sp.]
MKKSQLKPQRYMLKIKSRAPDFGLADAIILASTRSRNMKVLTGPSF